MSASPFLEQLSQAQRVLITTHVKPDGDALGSVAGLALGLRARGAKTDQLLLSRLPNKYAFIFNEAGLEHRDAELEGWPDLSAYDTLLITDTGTHSQLPGLATHLDAFLSRGGRVLVLDHHRTQEPWGTARLLDAEASSACELVARTLPEWGVALTRAMGEALYVGLVSDTGWFQFSSTTPKTLRLAADLLELGVDADRVYKRLYLSEREARIRLQTRVLSRMELAEGGKVAVMTVRPEDFTETGAGLTETENLINLPLAIETVELSILATDPPKNSRLVAPAPEPIRVSLRSKGAVDVSKLAEKWGGGGHARAAGLKKLGTLEAVADEVRDTASAWLRSATQG